VENTPQAEHIRFLFDPETTLLAFAGQRRRFSSSVERLSCDELASPSRCEGWTVADVLRHLVWVDLTVRQIWSGERGLLRAFDPRVTPNEAVLTDRSVSDDEIRDRYLRSTETMLRDLECADPQRFGQHSLSPAGRVPWWMSAVHVGWDSSVHERDVLLPLGRQVERVDTETDLCLAYALVLTSFFAGRDPLSIQIDATWLHRDSGPVTVQAVTTTGQDNLEVGSAVIAVADDPVKLIDAIAGRGPIGESLLGDAAVIHRLGGLARFFTSAPS
jgi:uncharacterized protein (TIGR03083 family)